MGKNSVALPDPVLLGSLFLWLFLLPWPVTLYIGSLSMTGLGVREGV